MLICLYIIVRHIEEITSSLCDNQDENTESSTHHSKHGGVPSKCLFLTVKY